MSLNPLPDTRPGINVIIPSYLGDVGDLLGRLYEQTWRPDEIQVIIGMRSVGRARNQGVEILKSNRDTNEDCILVFMDDDALPASPSFIEALAQPLIASRNLKFNRIGITGVPFAFGQSPSQNRSWLTSRQAEHFEYPLNTLESSLIFCRYGPLLITTICCATWLSVYEQAGGFCDDLTQGADANFFHRIGQRGYRLVMVPPLYLVSTPSSRESALLSKYQHHGQSYGKLAKKRPDLKIGPSLSTWFRQLVFILVATLSLFLNVFIQDVGDHPQFRLRSRFLRALCTYVLALGYLQGWRAAER